MALRDPLGEKAALTQSKAILSRIDLSGLPRLMRNQITAHILDNQLKKFTAYNRSQRRSYIKRLSRQKGAK